MATPRRRLILASASPVRLQLLRSACFDPEVRVSGVDETVHGTPEPSVLALGLATSKARVVAVDVKGEDALVIGCDSVLDVDGAIHGKPESDDQARHRLRFLRGRSAVLHTGHCIIDASNGREAAAVASTVVWFGEYSDAELDAYIATGEALASAGGFTLEGRSGPFVAKVDGDASNVMGLSLPMFRQLLGELGVTVMELWA